MIHAARELTLLRNTLGGRAASRHLGNKLGEEGAEAGAENGKAEAEPERAEQAQGRRIQIAYPGLDRTDRRAGSRDRPQTEREIIEGKP